MQVDENDVFGGTVNFAARVIGAIAGPELWLSERARNDVLQLGAAQHEPLTWERHDGVVMKGFAGEFLRSGPSRIARRATADGCLRRPRRPDQHAA
jgi:class 3 adenylate cyclase